MESDCCGAPEWIEGTGICNECKEHAEFEDIDDYPRD
jgi:hypothetical protein